MDLYFSLNHSSSLYSTYNFEEKIPKFKHGEFVTDWLDTVINRSDSSFCDKPIDKRSFKLLVKDDDCFNAGAARAFGRTRILLSTGFIERAIPNRAEPEKLSVEERVPKKKKREAVDKWYAFKKNIDADLISTADSISTMDKYTRNLLARYRFPIEKKWVTNLSDDPETLIEQLLKMPAEGRRNHLLGLLLLERGTLVGGLSAIRAVLAHEAGHLQQRYCFLPHQKTDFLVDLALISALFVSFLELACIASFSDTDMAVGTEWAIATVVTLIPVGIAASVVFAFTSISKIFARYESNVQDDGSSPMSWPERDADQQSLLHLAPEYSSEMLLTLKAQAVYCLLGYIVVSESDSGPHNSIQGMTAKDYLRQFNVIFKDTNHGSPVTRWQAALEDCTLARPAD